MGWTLQASRIQRNSTGVLDRLRASKVVSSPILGGGTLTNLQPPPNKNLGE